MNTLPIVALILLFAVLASSRPDRPGSGTRSAEEVGELLEKSRHGGHGGRGHGGHGGHGHGSHGGHGHGSHGHGSHGHGHGSHGSDSADMDVEEIARTVCNITFEDFDMTNPVAPEEVAMAVSMLAEYMNTTINNLEVHRPDIAMIVSTIQGPIASFGNHTQLLDGFKDTMKEAMINGICIGAKAFILFARLEIVGGTRFARDQNCGRSFEVIERLFDLCHWDLDAAAASVQNDSAILHELSMAVTGDMECLIGDIRDFGDLTAFLATGDLSQATVRQVQVAMGALQVWGSMIIREAIQFSFAAQRLVEVAHKVIETAIASTTVAPTVRAVIDVPTFSKALQELQHLLKAVSVE